MNRSLEALAIFTVCLAGILATVRFSAQADPTGPRSVAARAKAPALPPQDSGSAADDRENEAPPQEEPAPGETGQTKPAVQSLAHEQGCGLDRNEARVYAPQLPLLSQREIAERAIRSAPWRIYVLPAPEAAAEELATGYDEEYDAAMAIALGGAAGGNELTARNQIEEEYAAAELAAARETEEPSAEQKSNGKSLQELNNAVIQQWQSWKGTYADPVLRALENRWSFSRWPLSSSSPRAKQEARQRLLHRERAESPGPRVSWDDYLSFAERHLTPPVQPVQTAHEPKVPKSRLFPR